MDFHSYIAKLNKEMCEVNHTLREHLTYSRMRHHIHGRSLKLIICYWLLVKLGHLTWKIIRKRYDRFCKEEGINEDWWKNIPGSRPGTGRPNAHD